MLHNICQDWVVSVLVTLASWRITVHTQCSLGASAMGIRRIPFVTVGAPVRGFHRIYFVTVASVRGTRQGHPPNIFCNKGIHSIFSPALHSPQARFRLENSYVHVTLDKSRHGRHVNSVFGYPRANINVPLIGCSSGATSLALAGCSLLAAPRRPLGCHFIGTRRVLLVGCFSDAPRPVLGYPR